MGCATTTWRGRTVCKHSVPKLDRLAKDVGQAILITLVQGAYSNGVLSAGTHSGGGVVDVELDGYSAQQARFVETTARKDAIAWWRPWAGNWHMHWMDPECPSLAAAAKAQIEKFRRGLDALYYSTSVPGLPANSRKDTGDRSTATRLLALYDGRLAKPVSKPVAKPPAAKPVGLPTLKRGSRGAVVKKLQQELLRVFPAYAGRIRYPGGGPNDKFGPQTEAVVKDFQHRAKIVVDGIVGPQTWAALKKSGVRV